MGLFENEANGSSSFSLIVNNTALDTFGVYTPIADRPKLDIRMVLCVTDILEKYPVNPAFLMVKSFGIVVFRR